ncbi:MAG TPA: TIM44-like domain-containing protein, partial [Kofleriaceae bacterium]|nr:TIM44-like domain-containing protein [Kofleriaceae bacterium]
RVLAAATVATVLAVLGALAGVALARPGGGESYSGGGGHGGSGGGGGGGGGAAVFELIIQLIRLCFYYPKIGLPLLALIIAIILWANHQKNLTRDWDSGPPVALEKSTSLDTVKQRDPDFSSILFQDFVFRLYATAHGARGDDRKLDELAPYLGPDARAALRTREPRGAVSGVVIGAMRPFVVTVPPAGAAAPPPRPAPADDDLPIDDADADADADADGGSDTGDATSATSAADDDAGFVEVGIELEANYTVTVHGEGSTYYVVERWWLRRAPDVRTRPRDPAKGFPCPNCGAPWQASETAGTQRCSSCGQVVDNGRFDWLVYDVEVLHQKQQPPSLSTEVPERGTDLATYAAPDVDAAWDRLVADDPALTRQALLARLSMIYTQLNEAWAKNDLSAVRPYVSDGLYDYLSYWMDAYRTQGLTNRLENMHITDVEVAKVARDRWYDATTIRLWASGLDYVVRKNGTLVRGSKNRERPYSEYWTLVRSAARRGPANSAPTCSNCGAPAKVGMGGACEFCGAHVTSGEFDWVLSRIEQDDSYRG